MKPLERLSVILDILRKECPWDSAQTFESLRHLTIEEVYELSDAILSLSAKEGCDNSRAAADNLCKELGDVLMHVLFYSKIAADRGLFSLDDVCDGISDKLVSRHPHIALPLSDGSMRPALSKTHPGWEQVKMKEGRLSVLEGVPQALPSLIKAARVQEKANGIGYSQSHCNEEDIATLCERLQQCDSDTKETAGNLLFALVDVLRRKGINADEALSLANERYMHRVSDWEVER